MKIQIEIDDELYPYLRKYRELKRTSPSKIMNTYIKEYIVDYILEIEQKKSNK